MADDDIFAEDLPPEGGGKRPWHRGWHRGWRQRLTAGYDRLARSGGRLRRFSVPALLVLLALLVLYYAGGMVLIHRIDDDVRYTAAAPTEGGSSAVDIAAALIIREVDENRWTANDPFFMPAALLDNMPNYQQGIVYAMSRFAVEMSDQVGRARGSSQVDPALDRAAGLLRYPGDRWIFDFSASLAPVASSESQYRSAAEALREYNARLAAGNAVFERRADNLLNTIDRIASDLGSSSAIIAEHLQGGGFLVDTVADDIFYSIKGRMYGYYMILRELRGDFAEVIGTVGVETVWDEMLASLVDGIELSPLVVVSGDPDSQVLPSHLAGQGFYLLRARTQLREISNVLLN